MADYIKYGFEALDNCGISLHNIAEATGKIHNFLTALSQNNIEGVWEGKARNAFDEHAAEMLRRITQMETELETSKGKLDYAVKMHRQNELDQSQSVSKLLEASDSIF